VETNLDIQLLQFLILSVESWNKVAINLHTIGVRVQPILLQRSLADSAASARVDLQGAVRVYLAGYIVMADQHTML
jgi:hypothetical protein